MSQLKYPFIFTTTLITLSLWICSFSCIARGSTLFHGTMVDDALISPDIQNIRQNAAYSSSVTPGYYETSEYFIGRVAVGIVFLESNGAIDPSTETWTSPEELNVISEIQTALTWWANQNPSAGVSFRYDIHYRVPTKYEPINRPHTDENLWIGEALSYLGCSDTYYFTQVRDYINGLRTTLNTNWAFAIFVVDSSNDVDGMFTDNYFAYAYLGGPFLVMTYDNNGWGIGDMDRVTAHEAGHIFYATDEYDGITEYSGYLNVADAEGSGGIMDESNWYLSSGTRGQVGWRDSDGDGTLDILDTFPDSKLLAYSPDPTNDINLTYTGVVTETPYPNTNPKGTGKDVTINTIVNVEYKVDSGAWLNATATDGLFDETEEDFIFTTPSLSSGIHSIEARGKNSVGNIEASFAADTVTVDMTPPITNINYSLPNYVSDTTVYISQQTSFTFSASDDISGVADTYYKLDSGPWKSYTAQFTLSGNFDGTHTLHYYSVDNAGNEELAKSFSAVIDNTGPTVSFVFSTNGSVLRASNVNVSWIGLDDGSGVDHYEIRIDVEDYNNEGLSTSHTLLEISEGSHKVYVKAVDKLGNLKENSIIFVVDTTLPLVSITSPNNGSEIRSSIVSVNWTGWDEVSGIGYYKIRLDENFWIDLKTNTTYTFTQVGDGSHTIDVEAADKAGNCWQAQIYLVINTSLIGGPGWIDDVIVFGTIGLVVLISIGLFFIKKQKKRD